MRRAIVLLMVAIFVAVVARDGFLTYNHYCFDQDRYLEERDFLAAAFASEFERKDLPDGYPLLPIDEYLARYPDCCTAELFDHKWSRSSFLDTLLLGRRVYVTLIIWSALAGKPAIVVNHLMTSCAHSSDRFSRFSPVFR